MTAKTALFICLTISLRKAVHRNCFGGLLLAINYVVSSIVLQLIHFLAKTDTLAHSNIFQLLSDSNQCVSCFSLMLRCYPTLTYIQSLATLSGILTSTGLDPVLPSELP